MPGLYLTLLLTSTPKVLILQSRGLMNPIQPVDKMILLDVDSAQGRLTGIPWKRRQLPMKWAPGPWTFPCNHQEGPHHRWLGRDRNWKQQLYMARNLNCHEGIFRKRKERGKGKSLWGKEWGCSRIVDPMIFCYTTLLLMPPLQQRAQFSGLQEKN